MLTRIPETKRTGLKKDVLMEIKMKEYSQGQGDHVTIDDMGNQ